MFTNSKRKTTQLKNTWFYKVVSNFFF